MDDPLNSWSGNGRCSPTGPSRPIDRHGEHATNRVEPVTTAPQANAALRAPEAGRRVIRGGVIRAFGFGLGAIIATAAIAVVARHLQPAEFGRFASVMALIGIVTGLSDAGLTIVGAREVAAHADPDERRKLLANLLTLRCVLAPIAIGIGVIYALLVGWNSTDVTGTILVGWENEFSSSGPLPVSTVALPVPVSLPIFFSVIAAAQALLPPLTSLTRISPVFSSRVVTAWMGLGGGGSVMSCRSLPSR